MTRSNNGASRRFLVVAIGLALSGPALAQSPATASAPKPLTIEQRLDRLERMMANQNLVELFNRVQSLQREVETLRGQVEVQTHEVGQVKNRQRELYLDIDTRLQQLEAATREVRDALNRLEARGVAPSFGDSSLSIDPALAVGSQNLGGTSLGAGASTGGNAPGGSRFGSEPVGEAAAYEQAFNMLKTGDYAAALSRFKSFLVQFPQGEFSDNAQYWLGEAYYVTRDFEAAATEFDKVLNLYPDSSKVADARLKIGFSHYELGNWKDAGKALQAVIAKHDGTTASRLAEKRLQQMRLEGKI